MKLRNLMKIAVPLVLAAAVFATENAGQSVTVKGYVLDSACAFTKGVKKPVSAECALACAKAGPAALTYNKASADIVLSVARMGFMSLLLGWGLGNLRPITPGRGMWRKTRLFSTIRPLCNPIVFACARWMARPLPI